MKSIEDTVEGCVLVPLDQRQDGYPIAAKGVLDGTYYRIEVETGKVRAFVTIMPGGNRVAWDNCAKCYQHIRNCACPTGVYHPRSVAWIRATCDINYPTERVESYSQYYDPYNRKSGDTMSGTSLGFSVVDSPSSKPKRASKPVEVEELDMAELDKAAKKIARKTTRKARSVIRGS